MEKFITIYKWNVCKNFVIYKTKKIKNIYILKHKVNKYKKLLNEYNLNYQIKDESFFWDKLKHKHHQGIMMDIDKFDRQYLTKNIINKIEKIEKNTLLILDSIQDSHNFGAIMRTALAAKIQYIFIHEYNNCPINQNAILSSAGYAAQIKIIYFKSWRNLIVNLKEKGYWIYSACLQKDSVDYREEKFTEKTALIIGNEQKGIKPNIIEQSDIKLKIPLQNNVDSLNVSVATSILIFYIQSYLKII